MICQGLVIRHTAPPRSTPLAAETWTRAVYPRRVLGADVLAACEPTWLARDNDATTPCEEVRELATAAPLGAAVVQVDPPTGLRERVLQTARREQPCEPRRSKAAR